MRTTSLIFTVGSGPNGQILSDDAQCQAGESVVGGGTRYRPDRCRTDQPNVIVTSSRPAISRCGPPRREPTRLVRRRPAQQQRCSHTVTVYVLCASEGA